MNDEEIAATKALLAKLSPGFLPVDIFREIARLTVTSVVEIVPLRLHKDRVEVLMTQRDTDDPYWASMLHTPGTVIRATDREGGYMDAFKRILQEELGSVQVQASPTYVETVFHRNTRGMTDAKIFFVEVTGEPTIGAFYGADSLPANTVESQIEFIHSAAEAFLASKTVRG